MKTILRFLVIMLLIQIQIYSQSYFESKLSGYTDPSDLITLSEVIPFDTAIEILNKVSYAKTGRKIILNSNYRAPIGIKIDGVSYQKALRILVQYHNLEFIETESAIIVRDKQELEKFQESDTYAGIDSREVKIHAVFFEANINEMDERGINWQWLFSGSNISGDSDLRTYGLLEPGSSTTGEKEIPPDFLTQITADVSAGAFSGTATAAFKLFETENLGEIIAKPSITVRNKQKGRIQIGSDISIKQRDFAGNIIDEFYSTGTIIQVTPYIYEEDEVDYVLLKLIVERSSAAPDVLSTEITKTMAETEILMLDGEETVIGGLFINEESTVRRGVPILKDLPWWVFGLRYLTGYEQVSLVKKEVIILIETDIIPSLRERFASSKETNLIKKQYEEDESKLKTYKVKPSEK
ncbi:MAG: type II and III secretion system protein [Melioribacteraceae bacterium]|nr:type II and III secretion system protein [Melioribacteraceae bacterium]MCF8263755.1 type II and III secretion system protein [Melioribacteraceae bacterium]MCF8412664.1 type II and III secretion system protein [Melioribacteraceae bacterium]MCF8430990.1 type II and III secretion system protein [Melioribacteraceae bacterium]